jgi:GntR family transcriptional regulator, transcriptional repressor for pyruvate dehydrogenase complex
MKQAKMPGMPKAPASSPAEDASGGRETVENITARVLQLIQQRRLEPGGRLPSERELALGLGVSRPALRESLATLEVMRLIVRRPNSGIYLAERDSPPSFESMVLRSDLGLPLDREAVFSSAEVREILEVHAIELACLRRSDVDLSGLRSILDRTRMCLEADQSIIDLDESFHLGIVAATQNPVFVQIVHAFYRLSRPRRESYFSDLARCRRSFREHKAILRAIVAQDGAAAARLMRRHIEGGLRLAMRPPRKIA